MNRPWMPLYIADYLGDTGHLSTIQHGAYILLIMHYWRAGGLPTDDLHLARIAKLPQKFWIEHVKPDIAPLFLEEWRHKRIDRELAKQEEIATKRSQAGQKGGTVTATSRFVAKQSFAAFSQANAWQLLEKTKQLPSKRVAVTVTKSLTSGDADDSGAGVVINGEKEAAEKERVKRPDEITRGEFEEIFRARKARGRSI